MIRSIFASQEDFPLREGFQRVTHQLDAHKWGAYFHRLSFGDVIGRMQESVVLFEELANESEHSRKASVQSCNSLRESLLLMVYAVLIVPNKISISNKIK